MTSRWLTRRRATTLAEPRRVVEQIVVQQGQRRGDEIQRLEQERLDGRRVLGRDQGEAVRRYGGFLVHRAVEDVAHRGSQVVALPVDPDMARLRVRGGGASEAGSAGVRLTASGARLQSASSEEYGWA